MGNHAVGDWPCGKSSVISFRLFPAAKCMIIRMPAEMAEAEFKRILATDNLGRMIHKAFPEFTYDTLSSAKGRVR
jgi:hypothetical protein